MGWNCIDRCDFVMHKNVLIQALSFCYDLFDEELQAMIEVIGDFFDAIDAVIDTVLSEMNPFTATESGFLPDYERYYKCSVSSGDTEAVRRGRVLAAIRCRGDMRLIAFYRIADALGYTIGAGDKYLTIVEGEYHAPFRVGISRLDIDQFWDQETGSSMYDILVTGTDVESDTELQYRFNKQKIAGSNIIFNDL